MTAYLANRRDLQSFMRVLAVAKLEIKVLLCTPKRSEQ